MSPLIRFGLFYSAVFLLLGVQLPFFPVWLEARGLSEIAIGATLAAAFSGRAVFSVAVAYLADRYLQQRQALFVISLAAFAAFAAAGLAAPGWALVGFSVLAIWIYGAAIPLSDVAASQAETRGLLHYGRARAAGSAAFICANLAGGYVLGRAGAEAVIVWISMAALGMAAMAPLLPKDASRRQDRDRAGGLRAVAAHILKRRFLIFLLGVSAVQASHAVYYAFSAIEWSRQGRSGVLIGLLWAAGIVVEIVFFTFSARLTRRLGPVGLLSLGAGGAVLRWGTIAFGPPLTVLFAAQGLHALTFGATHLATVYFVRQSVPAAYANTAMTISTSLAIGLAAGLAALASAPIYAAYGGRAFFAMAGLGVIGLAAARALWRMERRAGSAASSP